MSTPLPSHTPLLCLGYYFQRGKVDALSLLLEHGAGLESRTGTDGTPLVWGCMGGDAQVVRYLLEKGADIDAVTKVSQASKLLVLVVIVLLVLLVL